MALRFREKVQRLALDGVEVKQQTQWGQSMVNDYLGIQDAIGLIADEIESLTNFTVPTSFTATAGGTPVGTVADVQQLLDGNVLLLPEVTGTPGFRIEFNFEKMKNIRGIVTMTRYDGSATHIVTQRLFDYDGAKEDAFILIPDSGTVYQYRTIILPDEVKTKYVDADGNAQMIFTHDSSGNAAHDMYFDYVALLGQNI